MCSLSVLEACAHCWGPVNLILFYSALWFIQSWLGTGGQYWKGDREDQKLLTTVLVKYQVAAGLEEGTPRRTDYGRGSWGVRLVTARPPVYRGDGHSLEPFPRACSLTTLYFNSNATSCAQPRPSLLQMLIPRRLWNRIPSYSKHRTWIFSRSVIGADFGKGAASPASPPPLQPTPLS